MTNVDENIKNVKKINMRVHCLKLDLLFTTPSKDQSKAKYIHEVTLYMHNEIMIGSMVRMKIYANPGYFHSHPLIHSLHAAAEL